MAHYFRLASIFLLMLPLACARKDDPVGAKNDPRDAASKDAVAHVNLGIDHHNKKDYAKAIEEFNKAIQLDPKSATAYFGRGNTHAFRKDYAKAIEDLTEAIRLDPKDVRAYRNRGMAYNSKADYAKAIEDFTEVIRLEPHASIYLTRGFAYESKKEYDKAIEDYTKVIQLGSKEEAPVFVGGGRIDAKAYRNRGISYRLKSEYARAIEDLAVAIQIDPKDAKTYYHRAEAYRLTSYFDKAIEDYSKTIQLDPKNTLACYFRADSYRHKYNKAIQLDPKDAAAHNNLAWLLATDPSDNKLSVRNGKRAIEHATKACELTQWKDAKMLGTLAAAHAESGNFKEAVMRQQEALAIGFDGEEALAKARQRLKLYQDGKAYRDE